MEPRTHEEGGNIQSLVFHAPKKNEWGFRTTTTKIYMPRLISLCLTNGRSWNIEPEQIASGSARDVLGGNIEGTDAVSPWVFKVQDWVYHTDSNEKEYVLGTRHLVSVVPEMAGWFKTVYKSSSTEHTLSVLVVARVPITMDSWLKRAFASPSDEVGLACVIAQIRNLFNVLTTVVKQCRTKPPKDLHTDNIGITPDHRVVLLDLECAKYDNCDNKSQALNAVKTFLTYLTRCADSTSVRGSWAACMQEVSRNITQWWHNISHMPSHNEIQAQMEICRQSALEAILQSNASLASSPQHAHQVPFTDPCSEAPCRLSAEDSNGLPGGASAPVHPPDPWQLSSNVDGNPSPPGPWKPSANENGNPSLRYQGRPSNAPAYSTTPWVLESRSGDQMPQLDSPPLAENIKSNELY